MYRAAPEVAEVAAGLLAEHHPALVDAPIVYIFRETAARSKGRKVLGRARLVTGLHAFLAALAAGDAPEDHDNEVDLTFFVMEIAEDWWSEAPEAARAAVVDHELCHLGVDEETDELRIRGHDLEEFNDVVARHGLWREDVIRFAGACGAGSAAACSVA